jgi:hypothetical protein
LIAGYFAGSVAGCHLSGGERPAPRRQSQIPVRLLPVGRRRREAADRAASHHHAAHFPRRHVLFGERPATVLADGLVNPLFYLISGFRWSFYEVADVSVGVNLGMTLVLFACPAVVSWIFRTGYRLKH